ncbi:MAG: S8 family serine peptidase [Defluviitaleaceae bacterium]|nr:S8 family serine peptidase [Defluviitaleaceae bacterium]
MPIEVIVKFSGDIQRVAAELGGIAELLGPSIAIVTIDGDRLGRLADYEEVEYVEMPKDISLNMIESLYHACVPQAAAQYGLTGEGTIVAVIDSGVDYTHPDFRNADGTTRIVYLWDMTAVGMPPAGFKAGHLYTAAELNTALAAPEPLAVIPQIDTIGHGTAVTGVAAGNGRASGGVQKGVAPQAAIVAVKLGRNGNVHNARTIELMRGLKFAADVADAAKKSCAINISFGTNEGSHDGNSLFEQYVDEIAQRPRISIAVAAGNEASAGHHFSGYLTTGEVETVEFTIAGGISNLHMVMSKDFVDEFSIEIITPTGKSTGAVEVKNQEKLVTLDGTEILIHMGQPTHYSPHQGIFVQMRGIGGPIARGLWRLVVTSVHSVVGSYQIWMPTTEEVTKGTAFVRPNPNATITMPATARDVVAVGAYDAARDSYAEFSGRGFVSDGMFVKPDIVAPGVNVLAARAGGGYDTYSGTSIAAPFVAGAAALLMEWGIVQGNDPDLYGQRLRAFLHLGATRSPYREYPNDQWGYGQLCLKTTLDYLRDLTGRRAQVMARPIDAEYADIPLHEYVRMPNIIDIITKNDARFQAYAKNRPYIKPGSVIQGDWLIAYLPEDRLSETLQALGESYLHFMPRIMGPLGRASLIASGILQVQQRPYLDLKGHGVLMGFIDTGIDYTLPAFKYEDNTTKIAAIWDMTAEPVASDKVFIGREYSREEINTALKAENPLDALPHRDTAGHGTFLASVAAGREENEYLGAAPDSEIIMVKLRKAKDFYLHRYRVPAEQENAFASSDILLAVQYVVAKAGEMGRPISLCFSLGTSFGTHDGIDIIDDYLSSLARRPGIAVCVAAGNEANTRRHAKGKVEKTGDSVPVEIRVGDNVPSFSAQFWNKPHDSMYVSVKSPTGEIINRRPTFHDELFSQKLVLEKSTVHINYFFPVSGSGNDLSEVIVDQPTPGIWTVTVHGGLILEGTFNAWMPMTGFMSNEVEFISPNPNSTVTMPGTALAVITCGAHDQSNNSLYPASSWGPTTLPINVPELTAPGVNVLGTYPAGYGTMSGTSVSSAITAGAAALMLQWGVVDDNYPQLNSIRIRSFLVRGCDRDPNMTYPNDQWGFGRLNLMQTFNILRGT